MPEWKTPDTIALHACGQPERPACVDLATGRSWTYAELDRTIQQVVALLHERYRIRYGERVAAIARNSADLLLLNLALERIGAIFVPINFRLSTPEQAAILSDCSPALLVTDTDHDTHAQLALHGRVATVGAFAAEVAAHSPAKRHNAQDASGASIILYTSGTSGLPKGVVLTGGNIYATAVNFSVLGRVALDSVFLCDSPMFHVIGLVTSLRAPLLQGGCVLISAGFDPQVTNDRLADRRLGVTHYFCVPQMAEMLRQAPNFDPKSWTSLIALFTGGSPNPPANIGWWLERGIRMADGFGMTEAGTVLGMPVDAKRIAAKAGSAGLPAPALSLRIVDTKGNDVPVGTVGEIWLAGPNVTPGYWRRPEETAKAFTPDGWFKTGDAGRFDEDGFVTVVDRKKDMFISGGENIFPAEIEAVLSRYPAISEVAVIGVPDDRWGEVGRAYIVLEKGKTAGPEELAGYCGQALAKYKIPKQFVVLDNLPRTASGKIIKHQLRALAGLG